ncbi:MAG: NAD(P)(+) transhydrogenase (Re/Si-specific) subunit beta, partial [Treponema sp.]|nr:NAD(P)(+) transhydrogenase (Re/Si-specific) subunit beta [Treponema sp.]
MIGDTLYYIISGMLTAGILAGIALMSKVQTAVTGNRLSAVCMAAAIIITLLRYDLVSINFVIIIVPLAIGSVLALYWAMRVKMIAMPETVAIFNGFGGAASALVGAITLLEALETEAFNAATAGLAIAVGMLTLTGSLVAAGKLNGRLNQKPVVWKGHQAITTLTLVLSLFFVGLTLYDGIPIWIVVCVCAAASSFFGIAFAIRIGGADMPITISLLNSFSGVAGSIAGMAINDPLLVAVGGIVGA